MLPFGGKRKLFPKSLGRTLSAIPRFAPFGAGGGLLHHALGVGREEEAACFAALIPGRLMDGSYRGGGEHGLSRCRLILGGGDRGPLEWQERGQCSL